VIVAIENASVSLALACAITRARSNL